MTEEKRCDRCGSCCKVLPLFTQHMHPEFKRYLLTRGLEEDKEQGCILIPHICQHLMEVGVWKEPNGNPVGPFNITYSCDIHNDPERPEICRKYKGQKIMKGARIYVPPSCAFRRE